MEENKKITIENQNKIEVSFEYSDLENLIG